MKITLRYWRYQKDSFEPDYSEAIRKTFEGENAKSCMAQIKAFRMTHDLVKYTPTVIVSVED